MATEQETESLVPVAKTASYGEGFKITLSCPQCGTTAWVAWKRLTHGLRCPKCRCQFLVGPQGKLLTPEELPQTQYRCPRCGAAGSVPTMLTVRRAECMSCKLPLSHGPDQKLHGVKEAAELHRHVIEELRKSGKASRWERLSQVSEKRLGKLMLVGGGIAAAVVLWFSATLVADFLRPSPDRRVQAFVRDCLKGDWDRAGQYVVEDDVEQVEYERWRVRNFASIIERFRPAGDQPELDVKLLNESPEQRTVEVTMRSPFLGERKQVLEWRLADGVWRFSPAETLARQDGRHVPPSMPMEAATQLTPRDRAPSPN